MSIEYYCEDKSIFCTFKRKSAYYIGCAKKSDCKSKVVHGEDEGDICNRDGCKGHIEYSHEDGCCSCSTSPMPPCGYCESSRLVCNECGEEF